MSEDNAAKVARFNQSLQTLKSTLPQDEQEFLTAIMWIAWLVTAEEKDLEKGFKDAFTPGQVDSVHSYAAGSWALPPFIKSATAGFIRTQALWP